MKKRMMNRQFHLVPWAAFTEKEIQALLKLHFEREGYEVYWIHKADSAHEKGTDLICTNAMNGKRVGIAVKKKPKKVNILQLQELLDASIDERIYVYIFDPARSFATAIEKNKGKVKVWNPKELERRLTASKLTLKLLIDNSRAMRILTRLVEQIEREVESERKNPSKYVLSWKASETISKLWGLKDRAVTLYKSSIAIDEILRKQWIDKDLNEEHLIDIYVSWLHFLEIESLDQLNSEFRALMGSTWTLLRLAYRENPLGSNWLHLRTLPVLMQPGKLIPSCLYLQEIERKKQTSQDKMQIIKDTVGYIIRVGWSLEGTIDQIFKIVIAKLGNRLEQHAIKKGDLREASPRFNG